MSYDGWADLVAGLQNTAFLPLLPASVATTERTTETRASVLVPDVPALVGSTR